MQVITEIYKYNNNKVIIHYVDNMLIEVNIFRNASNKFIAAFHVNTASFIDNTFQSDIEEIQTIIVMKSFAKMLKANKHKYLQSTTTQNMLSHMLSLFRND